MHKFDRFDRWLGEHVVPGCAALCAVMVFGAGLLGVMLGMGWFWPGWIEFLIVDVGLSASLVWQARGRTRTS